MGCLCSASFANVVMWGKWWVFCSLSLPVLKLLCAGATCTGSLAPHLNGSQSSIGCLMRCFRFLYWRSLSLQYLQVFCFSPQLLTLCSDGVAADTIDFNSDCLNLLC
eukprot:GHRR01036352.1.p1 GENE.GHRR01036352.1~~GHRR01036352.1.p1  ORF type:complete len:107 (-),score=5.65 GHRR01036352.1:393-713(-)